MINIDPKLDCEISQDWDMLELFTSNMLRNAIKYSTPGRNIVVYVESTEKNIFTIQFSNFCEEYDLSSHTSQINTANINYMLNSVYRNQACV